MIEWLGCLGRSFIPPRIPNLLTHRVGKQQHAHIYRKHIIHAQIHYNFVWELNVTLRLCIIAYIRMYTIKVGCSCFFFEYIRHCMKINLYTIHISDSSVSKRRVEGQQQKKIEEENNKIPPIWILFGCRFNAMPNEIFMRLSYGTCAAVYMRSLCACIF